jgi:hypothetical protein
MFQIELNPVVFKILRDEMLAFPEFEVKAQEFGDIYRDRRGAMVVDVVASRQRNYLKVVLLKIVRDFENAQPSTLASLASNPPTYLKLRNGEVQTMVNVAIELLAFGERSNLTNENEICCNWAMLPSTYESDNADLENFAIAEISGIGPALLEYLRMRSGGNSLKMDVRVKNSLRAIGVPVDYLSDRGVYAVCQTISKELGISMLELDQILWRFTSEFRMPECG